MSGKWHLTKHVGYWSGKPELTSKHNWPLQRGFDRFYGGVFGIGRRRPDGGGDQDAGPAQAA